uniref:Aspartic proteinase n=1 Tax=Saccharum hybrid cultivar R570 TaxID=131158 RepID=A0A059Q283_9POAL|nr:aspartic proteinase [Saccharum hybrid cultivar R570]
MASHLHLHLLLSLLCLVAASTAYHAKLEQPFAGSDAGFRAELQHPYAGSSLPVHDMWRRSARASKARVARLDARLAGNMSVPLAHISDDDEAYTVTVGIGTPPQPHTLIVDTASDLTWTQCNLLNDTAKQREPLFDPSKSSSFAFVPCSSRLCTEDNHDSKSCSNKTCRYDCGYVSVEAVGVLAHEAFSFGDNCLSFGFGCGALTDGNLLGASGILGMSPAVLSMVSQLAISGEIQDDGADPKRLDVPAATFALKHGGTVVDLGSTVGELAEPAFTALKEAVLHTLDLPLTNITVKDYEVCFALPSGVSMGAVQTPPLVLHFDGGADMVLPRDNYFQEPSKFLFAPTNWQAISWIWEGSPC